MIMFTHPIRLALNSFVLGLFSSAIIVFSTMPALAQEPEAPATDTVTQTDDTTTAADDVAEQGINALAGYQSKLDLRLRFVSVIADVDYNIFGIQTLKTKKHNEMGYLTVGYDWLFDFGFELGVGAGYLYGWDTTKNSTGTSTTTSVNSYSAMLKLGGVIETFNSNVMSLGVIGSYTNLTPGLSYELTRPEGDISFYMQASLNDGTYGDLVIGMYLGEKYTNFAEEGTKIVIDLGGRLVFATRLGYRGIAIADNVDLLLEGRLNIHSGVNGSGTITTTASETNIKYRTDWVLGGGLGVGVGGLVGKDRWSTLLAFDVLANLVDKFEVNTPNIGVDLTPAYKITLDVDYTFNF